jgi:hypothetical protein
MLRSMRSILFAKLWLVLLLVASLGGFEASLLAADSALSADEILRNAVHRAQQTENTGVAAYTYTKLTVTEELDSAGKVKERKAKVYQVSFRDGSSYLKLIEVNGHAPAEADRKKHTENEINMRQMLGQSKAARGDKRENFMTPELVSRFDFQLVGQSVVNGRPAYKLKFHPKDPEPPVRRIIDRLLNRISGTIWIDVEEFEIARADIYLSSEVNLLGGVVGSLKRLAYTITRTRMPEGIWFSTSSSGDFEGRKLLDSTRIKTKSQSTNFRPLG